MGENGREKRKVMERKDNGKERWKLSKEKEWTQNDLTWEERRAI